MRRVYRRIATIDAYPPLTTVHPLYSQRLLDFYSFHIPKIGAKALTCEAADKFRKEEFLLIMPFFKFSCAHRYLVEVHKFSHRNVVISFRGRSSPFGCAEGATLRLTP